MGGGEKVWGARERETIIEDLIKQGCLVGSVSGGHQDKSVYYPDIYTRSQNQWVDSFYAQNGYLAGGHRRPGSQNPQRRKVVVEALMMIQMKKLVVAAVQEEVVVVVAAVLQAAYMTRRS
nr:hypothetical protein BaRGS_007607 [Batillaria attramentaria]